MPLVLSGTVILKGCARSDKYIHSFFVSNQGVHQRWAGVIDDDDDNGGGKLFPSAAAERGSGTDGGGWWGMLRAMLGYFRGGLCRQGKEAKTGGGGRNM